MRTVLVSINCSYIHQALATRWLYVSRRDNECILLDFNIKDNISKMTNSILDLKAEVVGLSIYIWNADIMKLLIKSLLKVKPNLRIICGGPEVSYEYQDFLNLGIEAIIKGEGEQAFWDVVEKNYNVDGAVSKYYVSNKMAIADLDYLESLESPFFLEFDLKEQKNKYLYFETSRGCPYGCTYCLSSLENKVRLFSLEWVFKQLKMLEQVKCKQVKMLDRTFNIDSKRALDIAMFIEKLKVDVSFEFEVMIEYLSEELLIFFENCTYHRYRFEVGVQSFNDKTLKAVHRYQNPIKLKENIKRLSKNNILHTDLIAGLPYEDMKSFKKSFLELFSLKTTEIQVGILKLLKGTILKERAQEFGIVTTKEVPYTTIETNYLTSEDLVKITYLYHAVEKLYNNHKLRYSLNTIYDLGYDVYDILILLGEKIDNHENNIQLKDYFDYAYEIFINHTNLAEIEIKALLYVDYYRLFKVKPTNIFKINLTKEKKSLFSFVDYDINYLNKYSIITVAFYQKQLGYQLVIYSKSHQIPTIYYFNTYDQYLDKFSKSINF